MAIGYRVGNRSHCSVDVHSLQGRQKNSTHDAPVGRGAAVDAEAIEHFEGGVEGHTTEHAHVAGVLCRLYLDMEYA